MIILKLLSVKLNSILTASSFAIFLYGSLFQLLVLLLTTMFKDLTASSVFIICHLESYSVNVLSLLNDFPGFISFVS